MATTRKQLTSENEQRSMEKIPMNNTTRPDYNSGISDASQSAKGTRTNLSDEAEEAD